MLQQGGHDILLTEEKGCDCMIVTNTQKVMDTIDDPQLEFYKLIGEGFHAMQEGRTSTVEEVRELLEMRRSERD